MGPYLRRAASYDLRGVESDQVRARTRFGSHDQGICVGAAVRHDRPLTVMIDWHTAEEAAYQYKLGTKHKRYPWAAMARYVLVSQSRPRPPGRSAIRSRSTYAAHHTHAALSAFVGCIRCFTVGSCPMPNLVPARRLCSRRELKPGSLRFGTR
jgi:hypothetical protein